MKLPEATVAICMCNGSQSNGKKKTYGVRFEKIAPRHWKYTWAFPMKESTAKREGYDRTIIDGNIEPDEGYPGCPYCGARYFVVCSCGKLSCNTGEGLIFKCAWCGKTGMLTNYTGFGIRAGGDR